MSSRFVYSTREVPAFLQEQHSVSHCTCRAFRLVSDK